MKTNLTLAYLLTAFMQNTAYADEPPPQDFNQAKQFHIQRLTTELNCVQAAKSFQELQQCRPKPPNGDRRPPPQ